MKLSLLHVVLVSVLLLLLSGSVAFVHASSDDDFFPGDASDDFYPPSDDDDFYPPSDDDFYPPIPPPAPEPSNNPPVISVFSVPPTADKNTDITLSVTATDSDGGVKRIEILKDNNIIATQSCGNVFSCTKSFIVRVPDAFGAVYTFVARVFDYFGASVSATASGTTNQPAPGPEPAAFPAKVLEPVEVRIPSAELFVSSIVPDTSCLAPGAETFLYVSLKNSGKRNLDGVKITAIVPDLDVRAVSGPFLVRKGDSVSRFLYFDVPYSAEPGDYYIRVSVTSEKDFVVKYRIFEVNNAC